MLCLGYISKLSGSLPSLTGDLANTVSGQTPYYVEENEKLLNLLITNCEPILNEMTKRFDQFNEFNNIWDGFSELHQTCYEAESGPDLLKELQEEFSIRGSIVIESKKSPAKRPQSITGVASQVKRPIQSFSYKALKNNYLNTKSASKEIEIGESAHKTLRDEETP
jgi:hypothetical protein